jgi:protein tyrosine phosphatase (PTP) superfamily phosphohydrolase (DUF442 family)
MSQLLDAIAGVPNAAEPVPNLVTGGQPNATHVAALRSAGVQVILDIRDPMEPRPFDEPEVLARAGIEYINVSVTAATLDDPTLERVLAIVRANAHRPMLFHCASGNRVAGAMIPYLMIDRGMSEEAAMQAAMRMGLRGADVMQWGLDYAHRKLGKN